MMERQRRLLLTPDRLDQRGQRPRLGDVCVLCVQSGPAPVGHPCSFRVIRLRLERAPAEITNRTHHSMSKHLASQLGPAITVNTLALGPFPSKMMKATLESFSDEISSALPMQRIGKPEDVVGACLWLSGRSGAWVTGTVVPVDGGSLIVSTAKL